MRSFYPALNKLVAEIESQKEGDHPKYWGKDEVENRRKDLDERSTARDKRNKRDAIFMLYSVVAANVLHRRSTGDLLLVLPGQCS